MQLVIGGAYNGKLTWAVEHFSLKESEICDLGGETSDFSAKRCFFHLEEFTKRLSLEGKTAAEILATLQKICDDDNVIVSREIGCGIVPMEHDARMWREIHGQVLKELAIKAERVYRVFYGLSEVLK